MRILISMWQLHLKFENGEFLAVFSGNTRQNFEITKISTKVSYFSYFGGKLARKYWFWKAVATELAS